MAPPRKREEDKKAVVSMALTPSAHTALKRKARELAVSLDRHITPSQLVEHMVRKYVMKELKK